MKTTAQKLVMAWVIIIFLFTPSYAFFSDRVDKANKAIGENNTLLAKQLLTQVRNDNTTSDEENYKAGLAFESLRNYNDAHACFKKVKGPVHRQLVVAHYQIPGDRAMESGNVEQAFLCYKKLASIDKFQGLETVKILFKEGKEQWLANRAAPRDTWRVAFRLEKFILQKNYTLMGDTIATYYYKEFLERSDPCYDCYELSLEFSNKHREGIKKLLSGLYNTKGIPAGHKAELRRRIKTLAKNDEEFKALAPPIPPNFIVLKRGSNKITLKAGEITKKWITIPNGTRITGIKSADNMFKFIYPDGTEIEAWTLKRVPNKYKFKLQGVTNQNLNLIVG